MENGVIKCIKSRRSIRKFKDGQITTEELDVLLEAAIWAPSGTNNQSWLFTAIQNRKRLDELNAIVRQSLLDWEPDDAYPAKISAKARAKSDSFNFSYKAPTLIIASNVSGYQNAMADCSAALQNIMLAAHSLGLGSCWINQLRWLNDDGPVREYLAGLGLPREHVICGSVAVGYPDANPSAPPRKEGTTLIIQ